MIKVDIAFKGSMEGIKVEYEIDVMIFIIKEVERVNMSSIFNMSR